MNASHEKFFIDFTCCLQNGHPFILIASRVLNPSSCFQHIPHAYPTQTQYPRQHALCAMLAPNCACLAGNRHNDDSCGQDLSGSP